MAFWGSGERRSVSNEAFMCDVLEALANGREQVLLDAVHDEVSWKMSATQKGFFPFGGVYHGKAGVAQALADVSKRCRCRHFEPREVISIGEIVWGLFEVEIEYFEEQKVVVTEMAIRWRVRHGKILEHQAFTDTASLLFPPHTGAAREIP